MNYGTCHCEGASFFFWKSPTSQNIKPEVEIQSGLGGQIHGVPCPGHNILQDEH